MPTNFQIDHIVIMVDDLAAAMQDYTALGFNVLPGGVHADNPSHNALIVFEDGVYLEIIALRTPDPGPMSTRLQRWVADGPGLVDFALLPQAIEADIATARKRGLTIEDAMPGGRKRPDGQEIAWQTANLGGHGLPFFCADVTPRSLRVPEGAVRRQANGVLGVRDLTLAVRDLAASVAKYEALLGRPPQPERAQFAPGAATSAFSLEQSTITLAQPVEPESPLQAYLAAGDDRPYRLTLNTADPEKAGPLDPALTRQATITLVLRS